MGEKLKIQEKAYLKQLAIEEKNVLGDSQNAYAAAEIVENAATMEQETKIDFTNS